MVCSQHTIYSVLVLVLREDTIVNLSSLLFLQQLQCFLMVPQWSIIFQKVRVNYCKSKGELLYTLHLNILYTTYICSLFVLKQFLPLNLHNCCKPLPSGGRYCILHQSSRPTEEKALDAVQLLKQLGFSRITSSLPSFKLTDWAKNTCHCWMLLVHLMCK